jgi:hypothetical protein
MLWLVPVVLVSELFPVGLEDLQVVELLNYLRVMRLTSLKGLLVVILQLMMLVFLNLLVSMFLLLELHNENVLWTRLGNNLEQN